MIIYSMSLSSKVVERMKETETDRKDMVGLCRIIVELANEREAR